MTSIQEGYKLTIILINNDGYKSIGSLSRSLGSQGFGTRFLDRTEGSVVSDNENGQAVQTLPVDLAANARSLGAHVIECKSNDDFQDALIVAKTIDKTTVIYTECDRYEGTEGYSWWEVPVAEISDMETVQEAYRDYRENKKNQKLYY